MKNSMQTLVDRFKNYFGFEFGFERFTEKAINAVKFARNEAARSQKSLVEPEHLLAGLLFDPTTTSVRLLRANGCVDIEINEHSFESRENLRFSPQSKFVLELAFDAFGVPTRKP